MVVSSVNIGFSMIVGKARAGEALADMVNLMHLHPSLHLSFVLPRTLQRKHCTARHRLHLSTHSASKQATA